MVRMDLEPVAFISRTTSVASRSMSSVFGQDLLDGKVYAVGSLKHASVLTGALLDWMMRTAP